MAGWQDAPMADAAAPARQAWQSAPLDTPVDSSPPNMAAGNRAFARTLGNAVAPMGQTVMDVASIYAPIEAALNAGTGLLFGFPASVGAGLGGLIAKHALGMDADPKALSETMAKVFTYQPMTERGKRLAGNVMYPLEKLAEGAEHAGQKVTSLAVKAGISAEPTPWLLGGSPAAALGAVTDSALQMLAPILIGELGRKMGGQTVQAGDMKNAAKVIAGNDAPPAKTAAVERSLSAVYEKTGLGPYTVLEQAMKDAGLRDSLGDPAVEIPPQLMQYVEKPPAPEVVSPGNGHPLLNVSGRTATEERLGGSQQEANAKPTPSAEGSEAPTPVADAQAKPVAAGAGPAYVEAAGLEPAHAVGGLETHEVPINKITLSQDVPQFKSDADAKGVVEPLGGKFDRTGVAPIQFWQRSTGALEVISGRHRLELAERSGEKTIPAQVHYEDQGFDARRASALDAELNIRDGQGKVRDYVDYFRATQIGQAEANGRGLLARSIGRRAFAIASDGAEELVAAHRAGRLSDDAAAAIASAAPGDGRLQSVGIRAALDGKSAAQAANTVRAVKVLAADHAETTGDMFGFDDSAMKQAEAMAKVVTTKQREIGQRLTAITGAARRPELAKAEGIDIADPAAILRRADELKAERAAWDNWSTNPDLVEAIKNELTKEPGAKESPIGALKPKATGEGQTIEFSQWEDAGGGYQVRSSGDPVIQQIKTPDGNIVVRGIDTNGKTYMEFESSHMPMGGGGMKWVDKAMQDLRSLRLPEPKRVAIGHSSTEPLLKAQTAEDLKAKTEREANAPALDQRAQIDAEREHFQLQGEVQDMRQDSTGSLFDIGKRDPETQKMIDMRKRKSVVESILECMS